MQGFVDGPHPPGAEPGQQLVLSQFPQVDLLARGLFAKRITRYRLTANGLDQRHGLLELRLRNKLVRSSRSAKLVEERIRLPVEGLDG